MAVRKPSVGTGATVGAHTDDSLMTWHHSNDGSSAELVLDLASSIEMVIRLSTSRRAPCLFVRAGLGEHNAKVTELLVDNVASGSYTEHRREVLVVLCDGK